MPLVIVGIDEAGYGPTLGPLCVGMAALRVDAGDDGKTPDLWKLLAAGVCREPRRAGHADARGRIAVADSKKLKLANSVKTTHPLVHLERGVLAFARQRAGDAAPLTDDGLFAMLGARIDGHACYSCPARALPVSLTEGEIAVAAAVLSSALARSGVRLLDLRCDVTCEPEFNRVLDETGNKAATTGAAFARHLQRAWDLWPGDGAPGGRRLGIVCDRLGGRAMYGDLLRLAIPGAEPEVLEESETRSRYVLSGRGADGAERRAGVAFLTEGESAHLPVALASMVAKYVRELAMHRSEEPRLNSSH